MINKIGYLEGSFGSIKYVYDFCIGQDLENIDNVEGFTSFTNEEFKEMIIERLTKDFEMDLKRIIFEQNK